MKIEINTTEKKINILEEVSVKELQILLESIKNIDEYTITQSKEYIYIPQPTYIYPNYPYYPTFTTSSGGNITYYTNSGTGTNGTNNNIYNQNID